MSAISSYEALGQKSEYFSEWAIRTKARLRSEKCLEALKKGFDLSETENVEKDARAVNIIFGHLTAYALNLVKEEETAAEVRNSLEEKYRDTSPANQLHLFNKLLNLKLKKINSISEHFSEFDGIVSELRLAGITAVDDEQFLCATLLKSLDIPEYQQAVIALQMSSSREDLKIEKIKNKLRSHSLLIKETKAEEEKPAAAMAVTASEQAASSIRGRFRGRFRGHRGRGSYGRSFQQRRSSYGRGIRRGYSQRSYTRGQFRERGRSKYCTHCRRPNHTLEECRYARRRNGEPQTTNQINMVSTGEDEFGFIGMAGHTGNAENLNFYIDICIIEK